MNKITGKTERGFHWQCVLDDNGAKKVEIILYQRLESTVIDNVFFDGSKDGIDDALEFGFDWVEVRERQA